MGPWQYGEALGIPTKYMREFIKMFREDNNMKSDGTTFNKTPILRSVYRFKDGNEATVDPKNAQNLINSYDIKDKRAFDGKQVGHTIVKKGSHWEWADGSRKGQPLSESELASHPVSKKYKEDNGHY